SLLRDRRTGSPAGRDGCRRRARPRAGAGAAQLRRGQFHRRLFPYRALSAAIAERARLGRGRRRRGRRLRCGRHSRRRPGRLPARPARGLFGRGGHAGRRADPAARRDFRAHCRDPDDEGHDRLFRQVYPLHGGETILFHAAAGGVGLIACQWARALGVTMIGTVSTEEKAAVARAVGCTHTIVTSREDIAARVRQITGGKGVPVVFDSVGKDTLQASLDSLQPRGVLVSNGTSSGPVVIDTVQLAVKGSLWLTRPAMVHYATARSHMLQMAEELFGLVLAGKITSDPSRILPLEEAAEAHRLLEGRKTTGATVLVP